MANSKIIHELLKEVRDDQKDSNKKAQEHREETLRWQLEANARLDEYNKELKIHIKGVDTLKNLHESNVTRIEHLEIPSKVLSHIKVIAKYTSGIIGAALAIYKLTQIL